MIAEVVSAAQVSSENTSRPCSAACVPKYALQGRGFCHTRDRVSSQVRPHSYDARPCRSRFLEVDPIEGGVENDYVYPADPINDFDLDGLANNKKHKKKVRDGLRRQVREHQEKIRRERGKERPDQGVIDHWQREIDNWNRQIGKINRQLKPRANRFSRFFGRLGRGARRFGDAVVNLPRVLEPADCPRGGIACSR